MVDRVLYDAVVGGSSSGNLNCVSMVLTRDPDRKRRLYELHSEQEMVLEAPLVVTFCADWWRTREWLRRRGAKDNFNNLLGFLTAACDAMLTAQNACLGFENEGLGICYMGTTLFRMRQIADLLGLPATCAPVTTIVVGHPAEDPKKRDRLPARAFLHNETYRLPTSEEIDDVFREREVKGWERYMSYPGLRDLAAERGITTLAQFYTSEIKYDPDFFAKCSAEIDAFLRDKEFLP